MPRSLSRRPPSLDSLRVFEAAARSLSFTAAAAELRVSQAAVSQRIRALEHYLGAALFYRRGRRLILSEVGAAYMLPVRDALQRLDAATGQLFPRMGSKVLSLRLSASLATLWLMPRLPNFHDRHPGIDLRLITVISPEAPGGEAGVDLEIRQRPEPGPGEVSERLMEVEVFPVCGPALLEGPLPLAEPADLARHALLHVIGYDEDWQSWLKAAGVPDMDLARGQQFDASHLAVRAAEDGAGVALVRSPLVAGSLAAGRLVRLFPEVRYAVGAYHLVGRAEARTQPNVAAFSRWLVKQARAG